MGDKKLVKSTCYVCGVHPMELQVEDGRITKVMSAPENVDGLLCIKATQGLIPWNYAPHRVLHPMKRVGDRWEQVTWEEALQVIKENLTAIRGRYGPEALSIYYGTGYIQNTWAGFYALGSFARRYGTPNVGSWGENCYLPKVLTNTISYGTFVVPYISARRTKCIVLWGYNPSASLPPFATKLLQLRKEGIPLIVVDPRRIPLAKMAKYHLQLRPGTDAALALAMIHVIINEGLYDREFVAKYTAGFDKLVEHVREYTPERAAEITWVPADLIREAARFYASQRPTAIVRFLGLETNTSGFEGHRAVDILEAITGNVGVAGGEVPTGLGRSMTNHFPRGEKALGYQQHPLFCEIIGGCVGSYLADAILEGDPYPVRGMIIAGANPAIMHANSRKMQAALGKLDFVAQIDMYMNESSEYADIFLPAATCAERDELTTTLRPTQKAVEPPGQCLPDWDIWVKLHQAMGYWLPWGSVEETLNEVLIPVGATWKDLVQNPTGLRAREWGQQKEKVFPTPSGKIEIYSETLAKLGFNPLPVHVEPLESPFRQPELAKDYPLILIDSRDGLYFNARYRDIPELRRHSPEPLVYCNPEDARQAEINDGDTVILESLRGSIKLKTRVTNDVPRGVVNTAVGWAEANVNELTNDTLRDPVTGGAALRANLCRMSKA